jgi:tetratricopeptide (TPR) repeat protein
MTTILELIKIDFQHIFPSILNNPSVSMDIETLIDSDNKLINDLLMSLKEEDGVNISERDELINFLSLLNRADELIDEFDEEIEKKFESYIERYPGFISFEFFLIRYQSEYFTEESINPLIRANLYKNIFTKYSHLMNSGIDVIEKSNLLYPILLSDDPPVYYIEIFRKAVATFPHPILKLTLGRLYEKNGDHTNAIASCLEFLSQIESDRTFDPVEKTFTYIGDSITIDEHVIANHTLANLFLQVNEFGKSMEYCTKLLEHYETNKDADLDFIMAFHDPLIIKCKIHRQNNISSFLEDFTLLKSMMEDEFQTDEFKELLDYYNSL